MHKTPKSDDVRFAGQYHARYLLTTHAPGPQVEAKLAMNMQAATIMTIPEDSYSVGGRATPIDAKIKSQMACQSAP